MNVFAEPNQPVSRVRHRTAVLAGAVFGAVLLATTGTATAQQEPQNLRKPVLLQAVPATSSAKPRSATRVAAPAMSRQGVRMMRTGTSKTPPAIGPVMQKSVHGAVVSSAAMRAMRPRPHLEPPQALGHTYDSKVCAGNIRGNQQGAPCSALATGGNVVMLTWNWAPCRTVNCVQSISGFRIYRPGSTTAAWVGKNGIARPVDAKLITSVPRSQTAFGITSFKPADCFTVRAYIAATSGQPARESAGSNTFCLRSGMRIGTRSVVLTPKYAKNTSSSSEKPDKALGCHGQDQFVIDPDNSIFPIDAGDTLPSELVVGNHQRLALSKLHDEYACDHRMVTFHRAAVFFDLGGLTPPLSAAMLNFEIHQSALRLGSKGSEIEGDLHTYPFSCAASVGYATDNWLQAWDQQLINGNGFVAVPSYRKRINTPLTVNVLPIVGAWLGGSTPNRGFVLKMTGDDEREQSQNSVCMTAYDHFKLTVTVPRTL